MLRKLTPGLLQESTHATLCSIKRTLVLVVSAAHQWFSRHSVAVLPAKNLRWRPWHQIHNFLCNFKPYAQPPPKCGPWKSTSNWNDLNKYFISRRWHQIPITAQSPYCTQRSVLISKGNFLRILIFLHLWLVSQDKIHKTLIVLPWIYKISHDKLSNLNPSLECSYKKYFTHVVIHVLSAWPIVGQSNQKCKETLESNVWGM